MSIRATELCLGIHVTVRYLQLFGQLALAAYLKAPFRVQYGKSIPSQYGLSIPRTHVSTGRRLWL